MQYAVKYLLCLFKPTCGWVSSTSVNVQALPVFNLDLCLVSVSSGIGIPGGSGSKASEPALHVVSASTIQLPIRPTASGAGTSQMLLTLTIDGPDVSYTTGAC